MEKSIATKEKKVSNFVPNDLVHLILSKLPLKSLKRFGVVHKSWALLFKNSDFMSMYRHKLLSYDHSYYEDSTLLLHLNKAGNEDHPFLDFKMELYMLSGERFQNKSLINWPNPFEDDHPGFSILGSSSINGILCLYRYFGENKKIVFWNPAIEKFKIIPSGPIESVSYLDELHGFGYDLLKHDYKVIRHITIRSHNNALVESPGEISYDTFWEIYSLQSNFWKKLYINMPICLGNMEGFRLYMIGVCHWLALGKKYDDEEYFVSFNMSNEMFVTTHIPLDMDKVLTSELHISTWSC
jgi:molecular chaperone HtpG